jgi:tRNA (guanosine-2'-O-)-methyltransferase
VIDALEKERLVTGFLGQYISDKRKEIMERVLSERTRYITIVLEDIYQSQNASAVVRTCECMGLQDIHIIEDESKYSTNRKVLKGSDKWVDLIRYKEKKANNAANCFKALRNAGYKIYATDPSPDGLSIDEIQLDQKIALVMGNELRGTSAQALDQADAKVNIPMYGFTESLNISVSAAICLNTLIPKLRKSTTDWRLTDQEKKYLRLKWYRSSVRKSELLEREFLRTIG